MTRTRSRWVVMGVGLLGAVGISGWAIAGELNLDDVPAAVRATILREAAGGKVVEIERETERGRTVYEAEIMMNGREIEIEVAADGTLLEREEEVTLDQVPDAVRKTILKQANGARISEIERETSAGQDVYEAEWRVAGKETEIRVAADGTLLGTEDEDDDDDGDDDDEEDDEDDDDEGEHEEEISLDKVPAAARQALLKYAGGAKITEVERETENGVVFYEAEWHINGMEQEVTVTADGILVEMEESVDARNVPNSVRQAAGRVFPGASNVKYEKKTIVVYEVEGRVGGRWREVLVLPTGVVHGEEGHGEEAHGKEARHGGKGGESAGHEHGEHVHKGDGKKEHVHEHD